MTNINIGPYTMSQRTEFSKIQVFNNNNENISNTESGKKVLDDYISQNQNADDYFEIVGNTLLKYKTIAGFNIQNLFLPDYVSTIDTKAFCGADFSYFNTPKSLENIENEAFIECKNLKEINLPVLIDRLGCGVFIHCVKLEKVKLPINLKIIPEFMFAQCYSLKNIELPENLLKIDKAAFYKCTGLNEITLPDTVSEIENMAFFGCENLRKINIPRDFNSLGIDAFAETNINEIVFNHNLEKREPILYGNLCMYDKIDKITIANTVSFIDPGIFGYNVKKFIKKIEYHGNKKQFKEFKSKNKELFKWLNHAKINIINDNLDDKINNNQGNYITKIRNAIIER